MASKQNRNKQSAKVTTEIVEVQTPTIPEVEVQMPEQPTTDAATPVEQIPATTPVEVLTPEQPDTGLEAPPVVEEPDATPPNDTPVETPTEVPPPVDEAIVPTNDVQSPAADEAPKGEEPAAEQTTAVKKPKVQNEKALSAINAAARVLARTGKPMTCKELIGVMAMKGLWSSPKGVTPHATLYAAITREIQVEGDASRFVKIGRGLFAINPKITEAGGKAPMKSAKAKEATTESTEPSEPSISDGTDGPESLKSLFRI